MSRKRKRNTHSKKRRNRPKIGRGFNMSRKRNKRSKKRHGGPKIVADAHRTSAKRKHCRTKKKILKQKGVKNFCTICQGILRGQRKFLDCGHFFHRGCIKSWLKGNAPNCPNCRREISRNTARRQQPNLETRNEHSRNFPRQIPIRNGNLFFEVGNNQSPNADNLNMDVDALSPDMDNLNIDVDDQSRDSDYTFETASSDVDFSDLLQDQPGPSIDPSPNLDNPGTNSQNPSLVLRIPRRLLRRSSRVLGNSNAELPILFIPVLCCNHQVDSDAHPQQGSLESNEHIRSRILWDDAELHRQIRLLRILLKDRDFTFNVLNSPAELESDLALHSLRRYITICGWRRLAPSSSDEDEINDVD